jgi:hypothetical protein
VPARCLRGSDLGTAVERGDHFIGVLYIRLSDVGYLKEKRGMERVFIGATRAEATRMADEWWANQTGLRQTLRTEVAVGQKGPDAQLDQWSITIRYEDETPR